MCARAISQGQDDDLLELKNMEIGKRPILQFYQSLKEGYIRRSKKDTRYAPFEFQYKFLMSEKTNTWIIGANKSGKSEVCHIKTVLTMLGLNKLIPAPNHGYIVGVDWPSVRDTLIPRIMELIPPADMLPGSQGWHKSDRKLAIKNGSTAIFKSADSGPTKFQAATLDWLQIDEEIKAAVYKEARLRGRAGKRFYIWGAALPYNGFGTYLYKDIFQKRGEKNFDVFTATMEDNVQLDTHQVEEWKGEYHGAEYQSRIMGMFAAFSGEGLFNPDRLTAIKERYCKLPMYVGKFKQEDKSVSFVSDVDSHWKIWEMPKQGGIYSIGADPSTGTSEDPSCIQIMDAITREQVACYNNYVDEESLALQIVRVARFYNNANVIIEVTGGIGRAVQNYVMQEYFNLYHRECYDRHGNVEKELLGWETKGGAGDGGTKPILLMDGKRFVNAEGCIRDLDTVVEFQSYVRRKDNSTGARHGSKDDRVIALLLALRQINEGKCYGYGSVKNLDVSYQRDSLTKEDFEKWLYI